MKWLTVTITPSAARLFNAVMPAFYLRHSLNDRALLRAWKYSLVANYMLRRNLRPAGELPRQRHILHQCGDPNRIKRIQLEVERRGLLNKYSVEITLLKTD